MAAITPFPRRSLQSKTVTSYLETFTASCRIVFITCVLHYFTIECSLFSLGYMNFKSWRIVKLIGKVRLYILLYVYASNNKNRLSAAVIDRRSRYDRVFPCSESLKRGQVLMGFQNDGCDQRIKEPRSAQIGDIPSDDIFQGNSGGILIYSMAKMTIPFELVIKIPTLEESKIRLN